MVRAFLVCVAIAAAVAWDAAAAQAIVKCVDASGNVTYQDAPCTAGHAGRSIDLPKAESIEDTTAWEEAARSGRVVRGMPKRWVLRARGAPSEIRPGGAREEATEVWRYPGREGSVLVGFAGEQVAWVRDDKTPYAPPVAAAPKPAAPPAAAPPAPASTNQGAQNRKFVLPGRYCEHVFAEIGPADREEPLTAAPAGGDPPPAGAKRYHYDPASGDPSMRTAFSCVDGKVVDVERTVAQ